jgi:PAS domain S-box-containing protein
MTLDVKTIIIVLVFATFTTGLGLLLMAKAFPNRKGLRIWGYSSFSMAAGWIINGALRGVIPDMVSIVLGNLLITGSLMVWTYLYFEFLELKTPKKSLVTLLSLMGLLLYYYYVYEPSIHHRIVVLSFVNGFVIVLIVAALFKKRSANPLIYNYNLATFFICGLAVFVRMFYYLYFFDPNRVSDNLDLIVNGTTYVVYFLSILMAPFGFLLLNDDSYIRNFEKAKETIRKLSIGIEQSPLSIMITDLKGGIEYINPTFTQITGYGFDEVEGKNPRILKTDHTSKDEFKHIWETILSGNMWKGTFLNKKKSGELYWESAILSPVKNEAGEILSIIGIKQDITKQKHTEENLIVAKDEAEKANQLKSQFLANMSHDIRTPMNAVLGFSEILKEKIGNNAEVQEYLDAIQRSGRTLVGLINDILDLAKIESGLLEIQKSNTNIIDIVNEMKHLFSLQLKEKSLVMEVKYPPNFPNVVLADELRIRQVFLNLIGNAIKFTEKGKISVQLESTYLSDKVVSLKFIIEDTGIGISEEDQQRVFLPFIQKYGQKQARYGGSGLGLSITRKLLELMDGQISIESELNKGSRFSITLEHVQVVKDSISATLKDSSDDDKSFPDSLSNFTLLLVEDIQENRMVVRGFLKNSGINIIEAENGRIALQKLKENQVDLILMDIQMPEINGIDASKLIKADESLKKIPLIFLTADAMQEDIEKYSSLSEGYLTKPVLKDHLITTIRSYLVT